jgi:hypothetical protein
MPSSSVEILIEADDRASRKFENVTESMERQVKTIREVGGKAKASTELVGTLATSMGSTQFGGFAGQLAQMTERISAFSEVAKGGGAGALAFKAGLVGLIGTLTYQASSAIAQFAYGIDEAERALRRMNAAATDAQAGLRNAMARRFANFQEDLTLLQDPGERRGFQEQMLQGLNAEIRRVSESMQEAQQAVEDYESAWFTFMDPTFEAAKEGAEQEVQALQAMMGQLEAQREAMRDQLSERTARNERIREQQRLEAEIAAQQEQEAQREADRQQRILDYRDSEIERLQELNILLTQGAEAAKVFALERRGLDTATAEAIAAEEARLNKLREDQQQKTAGSATPQNTLTGVVSRLLTRGPAQDKQLQEQQEANKVLKQIRDKMPLTNSPSTGNPPLKLEFVG